MPVPVDYSTISNCIRRIEELLDEEIRLLDRGNLHDLDHLNMRKSHLITELSRLSSSYCDRSSEEMHALLEVSRRKAARNHEALGNYLRTLDDLNCLIMEQLRRQESAGTYSRSVATRMLDV